MKFLLSLFLLVALPMFGAVPDYKAFRGTGGIIIVSNPPQGTIVIDGSTIAGPTNGVSASMATNIAEYYSTNSIGRPPPPISSVLFNSNGMMQGSSGFLFTNGQVSIGAAIPLSKFVVAGGATIGSGYSAVASPANGLSVEGTVGVGRVIPLGELHVAGANQTLASGVFNQFITTTTSQAADLGGSFGLGGVYTGVDISVFGSISGRKENAVDGEYGGYLQFSTRAHGAGPAEVARFTSNRRMGLGTLIPSSTLDVPGEIRAGSVIASNGWNVSLPFHVTNSALIVDGDSIQRTDWSPVYQLTNYFPGWRNFGAISNFSESGAQVAHLDNHWATNVAPAIIVMKNLGLTNLYLMVGVGANDMTYSSTTFTAGWSNYVWRARSSNMQVIAFTVMPRTNSLVDTNFFVANNYIRQSRQPDYLIDAATLLPIPTDTYWYGDGVHPTTNGGYRLAQAIDFALRGPRHRPADAAPSVFFYDTKARVGLNTPFPLATLHVRPSQQISLRLDDTNGTPRFQFGADPVSSAYGTMWLGNVTPAADNYVLSGNGSECSLNALIGENITFTKSGSAIWQFSGGNHLITATDNTYDIGASGANRPRNVYVADAVQAMGTVSGNELRSSTYIYWPSRASLDSPADGIIRISDNAAATFNRLQFGGTTAASPAIGKTNGHLKVLAADGHGSSATNALWFQGVNNFTQATNAFANQQSGKVKIAQGHVFYYVTNSLVTTNSIVIGTLNTFPDAERLLSIVPMAGLLRIDLSSAASPSAGLDVSWFIVAP